MAKRARKTNGSFKADDPSTPQNEAFVEEETKSADQIRRENQRAGSVRRIGGKEIE
tara:strand:- start:23 stop:190 length:168 start_codon:yes stop_codon:yes gene_type:complete